MCTFALHGSCKFGARCRNRHPVVAASTDEDPEVAQMQRNVQRGLGSIMDQFTSVETAGTVTDGVSANCLPPPDYLQFGSVLLLGEGDFTFAAHLATLAALAGQRAHAHGDGSSQRLRPPTIIATSLQLRAEVLDSHPACAQQALSDLERSGATVLHGIDGRSLDNCWHMADPVECLIWNLPFAADIDRGCSVKSEPNQMLMRRFFSSVIRCTERWRRLDTKARLPKVHVTVSINQFADWNLLAVAHDCFLTVDAVHAFDPQRHGKYAVRRNERDDVFDIGQMRTYAFSVDEARITAATHALSPKLSVLAPTFMPRQR